MCFSRRILYAYGAHCVRALRAEIHTFLITSFNGIPTDFKTASVNVNSGTIGISVSDAVGLTVSDVVDLSFLLLFSLPPTRPFGRTRNCSLKIICNESGREGVSAVCMKKVYLVQYKKINYYFNKYPMINWSDFSSV